MVVFLKRALCGVWRQLGPQSSTKDAVSEILELRHPDWAESCFELMFNPSGDLIEG